MVLANGQHVRVQVDMPGACTGDREREADHDIAVEGAHHLAANLVGHDKHAQGHQFRVGKVPYFFLESDTGVEVLDAVAAAEYDIGAHRLPAMRALPRSMAFFSVASG